MQSTGILDYTYIEGAFVYVLPFLKVTIALTVLSVFFGTVIGIFGSVIEVRHIPVLSRIVRGYVLVCRSIPNVVLLYLVYYGLPILLLALHEEAGIHLPYEHVSADVVAVTGLSLHTGAYMTENFRAAIRSVSTGQVEAAKSLGMTWPQIFRRVVFPQASVFAIPLFTNQLLSTMKSTSIVFIITVVEITGAARLFCEDNSRYFEAYIVVACLYWGLGALLELLSGKLELAVGKFRGNPG